MSNRRFPFSGSGSGERLKFYPNMKAIIAEKPSVGMDIARVVGATDKKDGYCTGNGYMVTWRWDTWCRSPCPVRMLHENLRRKPPDAAGPVPSGVPPGQDGQRDGDGHRRRQTTENHRQRVRPVRQHHRGYRLCREGELIFRWIYSYLGYTKPFKRLWISSLTDEAIREGLANLRDAATTTACMPPPTAGQRRTGWWA